MQFDLNKSLEILERTPFVLEAMLNGLSEEWIRNNEGHETWSPYDVVGHLIYGEKTDWIPRMEIILSQKGDRAFVPFDRFAQFTESANKTLTQLLEEFKTLRKQNIERLRSKDLTQNDFVLTGIHPAFGEVTLAQLLSTWVVHDLNHISQISRVMAKQYKAEVGPWYEYLGILKK
ncbi:MAG TPA: DinB family protein [Cyclobacteriaceae bacterium]|nr:DinB family protein [Cyclobacteriaceae bacterium]